MELKNLDKDDREILTKKFVEEVILPQWTQLSSWNTLTRQTSQLDFGYLSQHLVSLITGIRGNNQRGKGDDLEDGSEVKSASCVDADDTPRWNNVNCGKETVSDIKEMMDNTPFLFFVLLDTTIRGGSILRCRVWVVRPAVDEHFRNVMIGWATKRERREIKSGNLQLHPPRWEKAQANITTNTSGNLKLPMMYESQQMNLPDILVMKTIKFDEELMTNGLSESVHR
ncbi:MamI family restriction endonuclease [Aquimarina pacifica]|uniref:MamI family restriction endonuclease n=1 Tax=Aquimarina pacifica TaxID=1296415 RepID=UPI00046F63C7|nr:MamI family restriction endonuclease [Aquimarina pacifica]